MAIGPGRPVLRRWKAPCSAVGIAAASVNASAQRVTGRKHSIWFGTSWSAPTSRPTRCDATSDITTRTGIDPAYDSTSGVRVFVAPGPVVTTTTAGAPRGRAGPAAPDAAPPPARGGTAGVPPRPPAA